MYNWTDGPSIISGTSLLLLDPHETWSATAEINCPGGPLYNFVKHHDDPQIQNQLLPFGSFHSQLDREFHGTVIRMPLRTNSQAQWSKIVPGIPTTSEDIEEVFDHFSQELADTLLFLKNVRRITLQVDDKIFAQADAKHFTLKDSIPIEDSCVGDVNVPYRKTLVDGKEIMWSKSFLCKINVQKGDNKELLEFAISHCMMHNSCMVDDELKRWSRSFKLFPWAAVAAPLQVFDPDMNFD